VADHERLRVLWPDHLGLARGKYLPARLGAHGTSHCIGVFGQGFDRGITRAPSAGFETGFPDIEATFDPATIRDGWEEGTGVVIADLVDTDGPVAVSPRHALRRAIDELAGLGYHAKVGIELEAFVLEPDPKGGWRPWSTPGAYVYGTGSSIDPVGVFDEVMRMAERADLRLECFNSESDVAQFEFTLTYGDALDAVDRAFLFRLMAREVAQRHGLVLTFMGRPLGDRAGSGMHVNLSLWDDDGRNAFADESAADGLSDVARHCLAGLVARHVTMTALCAPTVNAYKRLRPGLLAGYWANWGYDHRGTANRVPSHRGVGTRIENRLSDGAANPYHAVAAVLHAARFGIVDQLEPPPAETSEGLGPPATDEHAPCDLAQALDALESDQRLVDAIGTEVVGNLIGIKRAEWQRFAGAVTDWELREYLPFS
jgi:glutamine synthetase